MSGIIALIAKRIIGEVITTKIAKASASLRTSTKTLVGAGLGSQVYLALVNLIPNEVLVAALVPPEAVALSAVLVAWVVARFSKSPKVVGLI